jgi:hypothetical protein
MLPSASEYNFSDQIGYYYSEFFGQIYPFFHNHFVSYSLVLLSACAVTWVAWRQIKRNKSTGVKVIWGLVGLLAGSFAVWLVLFHFHTFLQADDFYMSPK